VIATDVGGIRDIITEEVGILVQPEDPKALGTAMARLASDCQLRRRMGDAARRKYEQLFTPRAVMPVLIDCYERSMNYSRPAANGRRRSSVQLSHPWCDADGDKGEFTRRAT
jgi:glycogen synthase